MKMGRLGNGEDRKERRERWQDERVSSDQEERRDWNRNTQPKGRDDKWEGSGLNRE